MSCSLRLTLNILQELAAGALLTRPSISSTLVSNARGLVIVSVEATVVSRRSFPSDGPPGDDCSECFVGGWVSIGAEGEDGAVESGLDLVCESANEVSRLYTSLMDVSSFIFGTSWTSVSIVTGTTVSFAGKDGSVVESQLVHGRFEGTLKI